MTFVIVVVGSAHGLLLPRASISPIKRVQESVVKRSEVQVQSNVCESEKYRFERNTECKSETLVFGGIVLG